MSASATQGGHKKRKKEERKKEERKKEERKKERQTDWKKQEKYIVRICYAGRP